MGSELKKVIYSLLGICLAFWLLDYAVGIICTKLRNLMPVSSAQFARINYSMLKCQADCIVLGSSRATHHYNTQIMADSLDMSVYNAGSEGRGLSFSYSIFTALCSRHVPRIIILELFYHELDGTMNDRINILKPYYSEYPAIYEMGVKINGISEKYKSKLASYRYNSLIPRILSPIIVSENTDTTNGYSPIPNNGLGAKLEIVSDSEQERVSPITQEMLIKMCQYAKKHGILLVGVVSPELVYHTHPSGLKIIFEKNNLPFIDNSNLDSFMVQKKLFNDHVHMNREGADLYTHFFIRQLKELEII